MAIRQGAEAILEQVSKFTDSESSCATSTGFRVTLSNREEMPLPLYKPYIFGCPAGMHGGSAGRGSAQYAGCHRFKSCLRQLIISPEQKSCLQV